MLVRNWKVHKYFGTIQQSRYLFCAIPMSGHYFDWGTSCNINSPASFEGQVTPARYSDKTVRVVRSCNCLQSCLAISLRFTEVALLTSLNFSFIVNDDLTCENDIPDSSQVMSISLPLAVNHPCATSTLSSIWMKMALLLMCVLYAWWLHNMNDSDLQSSSLVFIFVFRKDTGSFVNAGLIGVHHLHQSFIDYFNGLFGV